MKKTSLIIYGICLWSTLGFANENAPRIEKAPAQVVQELDSFRLQPDQVGDILDRNRPTKAPVSDLAIIGSIRIAPPPSSEGIPGMRGEEPAPMDVIGNAYTSAELIAESLKQRRSIAIGPRIDFLRDQAKQIIQISASKPTEVLLRLTLNRSVDVVNHVLPIAGLNSDYLAQQLANFMRENFELAAAYGNNKIGVQSRFALAGADNQPDIGSFLRKVSIAEYGFTYASLLQKYSQGLSSEGAQAILLMRMLGYLGWDFNSDLRRREGGLAKTIADIYLLQHSSLYNRILARFANNQEPSQAEVAQLRSRVLQIMLSIPERFASMGLSATQLPMPK